MLRIWGRTSSINVQKVLWAADELGLDYERTDAGLQFGVVGEDWFAELNPNRRIPTIDDDGVVVWESNAILRYLATKHMDRGLMPADLALRAEVDMWMDWQQTTVMPWLGPLFLGLIRTRPEDRDPEELAHAADEVAAALQVLDAHLAGRSHMVHERFTVADIPLGCVAYRWYALDVTHPEMPNLRRWYDALTTRPAFAARVMLPLV
jgi:glutathione S-transferase